MGWADYYQDRVNSPDYESYFRSTYSTLLWMAYDWAVKQSTPIIVEEGCGIGSVTKQLLPILPHDTYYRLFDRSMDMVCLAQSNLQDYIHLYNPFDSVGSLLNIRTAPLERVERMLGVRTSNHALFYNPKVTLTITHGVLEHLTDGGIQAAINFYFPLNGTHQLHYVPLEGYKTPSYGDERLLPLSYWKDMLKFTKYTVVNNKDLYFFL